MWYVIQTKTGKEELIQELIRTTVPEELYEDCKFIRTERKQKTRNGPRTVYHVAFPGYLFLVTDQVLEVREYLKKIPELTKLLGYDGEIVPIHEKEEEVLASLINKENLVTMSYGIKEGDQIVVISGALKGREFLIRKINRHKMVCYIDLDILGAVYQIPIGLETVEKKKEKA